MLDAWLGPKGRRAALFATVLLSATTPIWAAPDDPRSRTPAILVAPEVQSIRSQIAPLIRAAQERFEVPAISLALVRGTELLWAEGFGHSDQEDGTPATARTVYRAGSLAKPLTVIGALQLEEDGEIDIDQPLQAYVPEFFIRSRFDAPREPITVRSILSHHSGLPTDLNKGMWTDTAFTHVARQLREEYTAFPPNLVFSYSNIGFTLIGHMIEEVSGLPFAEYMERRVFEPLGMAQSTLAQHGGRSSPLAQAYRDGRPFKPLPIRDTPALGLKTSAGDLARLMAALLSGGRLHGSSLIEPETLQAMFAPQNRDVALDLEVINGLGWFIEEESIPGGGIAVRHGGTTLAFASELILLPERQLGVAVLANADGSRPIVSRLAEGILKSVLKVMPDPPATSQFLLELDKARHRPETAEIDGSYATDFGLISIQRKDPKLCACLLEQTFDLIPYPDGWYGLGGAARSALPSSFRPLAVMRFQTQVIDGREVVVAKKGDRRIVMGEKVPETPVPTAWRRRVGRYQVINPDPGFPVTEAELKIREGQLCMSYRMPVLSADRIQVPLRAISDTDAVILGLGRTRGETLRAIEVSGQEHLRYSGLVGRKVAGQSQHTGAAR